MLAYKGFNQGLTCLGYHFKMGLNITEEANSGKNGFHCAENPLDCLFYYGNTQLSEYYLVDAGGDVNEDGFDSKIACTELRILKRITLKELILHGLAYMDSHPLQPWAFCVKNGRGVAYSDYAIVRGKNPIACGKLGTILALAKEAPDKPKIVQLSITEVDGKTILPDIWYDVDLKERPVDYAKKSGAA